MGYGTNKYNCGDAMKILSIVSNPIRVDPRVYYEAQALIEEGYVVDGIEWDKKRQYISQYDCFDGISIYRVRVPDILNKSVILRESYWFNDAFNHATELFKHQKYEVVHCHDLDTIPIGIKLKKKYNCKLIYDAHENFPEMIKGNVPKLIYNRCLSLEKQAMKYADHLITVSQPCYNHFKTLYNSDITIVRNCKDIVYQYYQKPQNDAFTLIYIGVMLKERFIPQIIDIVEELDGVKLIIGGKQEALYEDIKKKAERSKNTTFIGTVPMERIIPLTHSADATFLFEGNKRQETLFNKQFEAMTAGRPIIMREDTYAGQMTKELDIGYTVKQVDVDHIIDAIEHLRDHPEECERMGRNALECALTEYNWSNEKKKLIEVYNGIL